MHSLAYSRREELIRRHSFTHNLYQYLALLGAPVSVYRTREISLQEIEQRHPALTHLVISPGPGHPLQDSGISIDAIKHYAGKVPILGVCMGLQCIFAAYGGSVDAAGEIIHGKTSVITHDGKGLFRQIPQGVRATRYHSLAGAIESLPAVLEITSRTKGGVPGEKGGIVMGVRHRDYTIESVQYHPESILSEYGQEMFANFMQLRGGKWADNPVAGVAPAKPAKVDATAVPTILETIAKQRFVDVAKAKATPGSAPHDLESLISLHVSPPLVDFHRRLLPPSTSTSHPHVALMGEVKRASPSKGDILPAHSPLSAPGIALEYALAGASVISVLTEPKWFKGCLEDLRAVRAAVDALPNRPAILRKDFILDTYQIDEARVYGADTVLLIVAILDDVQLKTLYDHARRRGMEPLVEVNNAEELDRALALGAAVIGVNNRNLHDFEVDMQTTTRMAEQLKQRAKEGNEVVLCALSGIAGRQDVERYVKQGVGAVLVGEALMRATDKGAFVRQLLGPSAPASAHSSSPSPIAVPDGLTNGHTEQYEAPLVKICGIKTPEVALSAAEAGADLIGLMFHAASKRNVSLSTAQQIVTSVRSRALPSLNGHSSSSQSEAPEIENDWFAFQAGRLKRHPRRPLFVGVFQNASLATVLQAIDTVGLDLVQLHGDEPLGWTRLLPVPVIKAFHVSSTGSEEALRDVSRSGYHALPLLDTAVAGKLSGGAGKAFDWSIAERLKVPHVLAGGLDPTNVARAVGQVRPFAVDVSGGVETDGEKDVEKIRAFVKAAKGTS